MRGRPVAPPYRSVAKIPKQKKVKLSIIARTFFQEVVNFWSAQEMVRHLMYTLTQVFGFWRTLPILKTVGYSDFDVSVPVHCNLLKFFWGVHDNVILMLGFESACSGNLHWRNVFVYLNKTGQVTVRLQSKHMRGALTKNRKSKLCKAYPSHCML